MYTDKKMYIFRSFWDREECHRALVESLQRSKRRVKNEPSRSNSPNIGPRLEGPTAVQAALDDDSNSPKSEVGMDIDEDPNQAASSAFVNSKKSDANGLDDEAEESGML